jgi:hypothetical protein
MHHPVRYETIAKIMQAEMRMEAAAHRSARAARADSPQRGRRWWVSALWLGTLAISLGLLVSTIWAG